jgi:hypothetical protein
MKAIRCVALGALLCSTAQAFEIEHVESKYQDKQYRLALTMVLDAAPDRVQSILRDYANYPKLDPRILEAKVLERAAPNEALLYTKLQACFAFFCRSVKRVERVREFDDDLQATVIPGQSEVTSGETRTQLSAIGTDKDAKTRVTYTTGIAPGFWIPSIIGRPLMLRTLREASIELFRNVERQAQDQNQK